MKFLKIVKKMSNEVKVGLFFILCVIGLLYLTLSTGKFHVRDEGYSLYAEFEEVAGLQKNAPVLVNGLEVGRVQDLHITKKEGRTKITLKLLLPDHIKIGADPILTIKTLGLMGEKYVHIKTIEQEPYIAPDSVLIGKSPADLDAIFGETETLAQEVELLMKNLNKAVEENREALKLSISNIGQITEQLKLTLNTNKDSLDNIVTNFEASSENLEELTADLKRNPWKLFFRTKEKKAGEQ